ncbi:MAG TPA: alpha-amylase family glycosyl hydrolase [Gemmatimonadales bacterium]|nr:alpha-amylase family glycosyl hydrolase [Gemmatimonadales bacterium]
MIDRRLRRALSLTAVLLALGACSSSDNGGNNNPPDAGNGTWSPGQPLALNVGAAFPAGTVVRDVSSGSTATVSSSGTVSVTPDSSGVVLLEKDGATPTPFSWANATVYFVLTDRFFNGDSSNDNGYGTRPKDGTTEIGTWHGGDWKGIVDKLDHIASLGATAIWISPIVEQVHGWVGGGSGDFKHYAYAGYWALDFTRLDANWGNEAALQNLVDQAHARGIRVLVDVVLNHPGYATGDDLLAYLPAVFKDGTGDAFKAFVPPASGGYQAWNDLVNYNSDQWVKWWGPDWIRAGFPGHFPSGGTDETRQLASLPDFRTESPTVTGRPVFFDQKPDTAFPAAATGTVRDFLVQWHTGWLEQFGFDGFRCDTVKNVELASWKALKDAALPALGAWKTANPSKKIDDAPFWMVGEVFPHGVQKDSYYTDGGFDSLLNFEFQNLVLSYLNSQGSLVAAKSDLEALYSRYASMVSTDPSFNILSYLSSHDTQLFYASLAERPALQKQAGTALLLAPGGVQVFYGDESGRVLGPAGTDQTQGTRSDMNWASLNQDILAHFQKVGGFRKRHVAVGAGAHQKLDAPSNIYAFSRTLRSGNVDDSVVVAITPTN